MIMVGRSYLGNKRSILVLGRSLRALIYISFVALERVDEGFQCGLVLELQRKIQKKAS